MAFQILNDHAQIIVFPCFSDSSTWLGKCRSANCKCTAPPSIPVKTAPPNNLTSVIKRRRPC